MVTIRLITTSYPVVKKSYFRRGLAYSNKYLISRPKIDKKILSRVNEPKVVDNGSINIKLNMFLNEHRNLAAYNKTILPFVY